MGLVARALRRSPSALTRVVPLLLLVAAGGRAAAQSPPFVAGLDREAVAPGEPFVYEVTLTLGDQSFENFRPPDFKGLTVVSAARFPNRAMQVQMGGGQTHVENRLSWRYELAMPAGAKAGLSIGAARVRVDGRDLASNVVPVRIGAATGGSPGGPGARARGGGMFPRGMVPPGFFGDDASEEAVSSTPGVAFIRAVADKSRVLVGEQVTVSWLLYLTESQNNFRPLEQPRTDGFWSEDIPSTNPQGRLAFTERVEGGRSYSVAVLLQKALFPLAPGKLTVTPMEAEVSQADFFGRPVRTRRLKSDPVAIDAVPLPREGQPAGFDAANVGRYTLAAAVDRAAVAVGDAVTLTVTVKGEGNVRNVHPPELPTLVGWKTYEPKTTTAVEPGQVVSGAKTVEWLLRPEHGGKVTIPAMTLPTFDPAAKQYAELRTAPIELVVSGGEPDAAAGAPTAATAPAAGDNVIVAAIRPIRVRPRPGRELGAGLLHGPAFTATLIVPPVAFLAFTVLGRVRRRLGADSGRTRRRRFQLLARRRLRAAETHRAAGAATAFYVEIDRVLRELLSERLREPVAGLRLDELRGRLAAGGFSEAETARLVGALEACDEARFAPGGERGEPSALAAKLAEAEELIAIIQEKA